MAYSSGTAADAIALLQALVSWLTTSRGWTSDTSVSTGSGWRATLHKGSLYMNFRAMAAAETATGFTPSQGTYTARAIYVYPGTSYNSGNGPFAQPGGPIGYLQTYNEACAMQLGVSGALVSYDFFDDGLDNITVVCEKSPGIFSHMAFGPSIVKAGSWTGGVWCVASSQGYTAQVQSSITPGQGLSANAPGGADTTSLNHGACGYIRADVDAFTGQYVSICAPSSESATLTASNDNWSGKNAVCCVPNTAHLAGSSQSIASMPPTQSQATAYRNQLSSLPFLLPCRIYVTRDAGGMTVLGDLPNLYYSEGVGNGVAARQEVAIGADTFKFYPNFCVKKV